MLASMFVTGGIQSLRNAQAKAPAAQPVADAVVPLAKKAGIPLPRTRPRWSASTARCAWPAASCWPPDGCRG
jgi:hypothetical protein